jgi:hypothetical protein
MSMDEPDFEMDDLAEQADEVGKLSPREYAKLRGLTPQLVYYYLRTGKIVEERCICGRKVIDVKLADEAMRNSRAVRDERSIDARSDEERERDHR